MNYETNNKKKLYFNACELDHSLKTNRRMLQIMKKKKWKSQVMTQKIKRFQFQQINQSFRW